jgi:hypothetical protein
MYDLGCTTYNVIAALVIALVLTGLVQWALWSRRMYLRRYGLLDTLRRERCKSAKALKEKDAVIAHKDMEIRNGELALQMAEKDLNTGREHMAYYIENCADLEKLIVIKDQEISDLERKEKREERKDDGFADSGERTVESGEELSPVPGLLSYSETINRMRGLVIAKAQELRDEKKLNQRLGAQVDELERELVEAKQDVFRETGYKNKSHELIKELQGKLHDAWMQIKELKEIGALVLDKPDGFSQGNAGYDPKNRLDNAEDLPQMDTNAKAQMSANDGAVA